MKVNRAVVVGAGMTGLLAARVLSDMFDSVLVIDRDDFADASEARGGVPQGRHVHGLLASGERFLGHAFPGLIEELVAGGAVRVGASDLHWWQYGGYRVPGAWPDVTFCSRPFLEHGVRRRVSSLSRVAITKGVVRSLGIQDGQIAAVIADRGGGSEAIPADLVVDASGRASRAVDWLEAGGFPTPDVDAVHVDIRYVSRLYSRTSGRLPDSSTFVIFGDPGKTKRSGFAVPIEKSRWIVSLVGCHGDRAPADEAGYLRYADSLPADDIADIIRHEEPLAPIVTYRLPSSQWRHFEKVRYHPAGFLAMGDAICSFNPIYGQGMSVAAMQCAALVSCIERVGLGSPQLAHAFYRSAAKIISDPWTIAVTGDFAYPETTGPRAPFTNVSNRLAKSACIAAQRDPVVAAALMKAGNLLAPLTSLMRPNVLLRILHAARGGPTGKSATAG